jgi:integrase
MGKSLRNLASEAEHRLDDFDAAEARALKPGGWLTFAGYGGLRLSRSAERRTWAYRYASPIDGRLRQIRLGSWPAVSWAKAVARWEELRHARDEGADPQLERRRKRAEARERHAAERGARRIAKGTVAKLAERYLADRIEKARNESGAAKVRRLLSATIVAKFGKRPASEIGRRDAVEFLLAEKRRAPQQTLILRRELGSMWRFATATGFLPESAANPWSLASAKDLGLKHTPRSRVLNDPEVMTFLSGLDGSPQSDALRFLLYVGCRSGEAVGIKAGDIVKGVWHLVESKTGTVRNVRLPKQAREILARHPKGFGVSSWTVAQAVREANCFGLPAFVVHDLRRTLRTGLSRLGVREEIAEAALGHTKGGIVGVYDVHRFEAEVGEALQKWCDHLDALQAPGVLPIRRSA